MKLAQGSPAVGGSDLDEAGLDEADDNSISLVRIWSK